MIFVNILFFVGNIGTMFAIRKLEKSKINCLIDSNITSCQSVNMLVDTLDNAIKHRLIDDKRPGDIPID